MYPYIRSLCASGQAECKLQQCLPKLLAESMCKAGPKPIPQSTTVTASGPKSLLRTDCTSDMIPQGTCGHVRKRSFNICFALKFHAWAAGSG